MMAKTNSGIPADHCRGIGVVIDDRIFHEPDGESGEDEAERDRVGEIVSSLEKSGIPMLKFDSLPTNNTMGHFLSLSFLILDWKLQGVSTMTPALESLNIGFIEDLSKVSYCPIFIFTNEPVDRIKKLLRKKSLIGSNKPSRIFVENKDDLLSGDDLLQKIEGYLKKSPPIYLLQKWQTSHQENLTGLYNRFEEACPLWPEILWKTYEADKLDPCTEMTRFLSKQIEGRMKPVKFEADVICPEPQNSKEGERGPNEPSQDQLKSFIENTYYISYDRLASTDISTGDLFCVGGRGLGSPEGVADENTDSKPTTGSVFCCECSEALESGYYYLNIRARCDLRGKESRLYCLKGIELDESKEANREARSLSRVQGQILGRVNQFAIPFLHGGKSISFSFKEMVICRWGCVRKHRIGRVLPPYIIRAQQAYAAYSQREGLPRIPEAIELPFIKEKKQEICKK